MAMVVLHQKYILQIFSCLFILLAVAFEKQKYFIFIKSSLSLFSLMLHAFSDLTNIFFFQSDKDFLLYFLLEML